jgi:hypothetical protein
VTKATGASDRRGDVGGDRAVDGDGLDVRSLKPP